MPCSLNLNLIIPYKNVRSSLEPPGLIFNISRMYTKAIYFGKMVVGAHPESKYPG
jgi:hypothetical protein